MNLIMGQSCFTQIKPSVFKKYLSKKYYGKAPFNKKHSYAAFKTELSNNPYGEPSFPNIIFTYQLLIHCAKTLHIEPTTEDKVISLKLFEAIHNKAISKICKCCKGSGYTTKINNTKTK